MEEMIVGYSRKTKPSVFYIDLNNGRKPFIDHLNPRTLTTINPEGLNMVYLVFSSSYDGNVFIKAHQSFMAARNDVLLATKHLDEYNASDLTSGEENLLVDKYGNYTEEGERVYETFMTSYPLKQHGGFDNFTIEYYIVEAVLN